MSNQNIFRPSPCKAPMSGNKYYLPQPHHVNFAWRRTSNEFYIYRNIGRLTRPLLIVERTVNDDVTIKLLDKVNEMNKNLPGSGDEFLKSPILELVKQGYVEFLDCNEQDTIAYLADSTRRVDEFRITRRMAANNLERARNNVESKDVTRLQELKRRADRDLLDLTNCEIDSRITVGYARS